ncbi:MAG: UDP-N-acetylmuramoyl-L-alanyl-D-glutamate--2,6-diaminopimelate ligase [Patescibacteria group bacterium]|jgi:UDP-N-acetylmuramoyl-L-alanyl-D-glutamate--2,6-diaminopimelate ligase
MKQLIKRLLPAAAIDLYHKWFARLAARRYGYPSEKITIIGVTGTKGKSTTCNLIWSLLTAAGYKVGIATTANFKIGDQEWLNPTKMTMLGRSQLQKLLADMVQANCQYAVIETSSEGIKQWRHLGIHYDVCVWTNLFPEHIEAHGSFEAYKQAKLELFHHLVRLPVKRPKAVVLNGDSAYSQEFIDTATVPTKIIWTRHGEPNANLTITNVVEASDGLKFTVNDYPMTSQLLGEWNLDNIASAIGVALTQGLDYPTIKHGLEQVKLIPGRMERIDFGQPFTVIVDYAYEPVSLRLLYSFWRKLKPNQKLITLISSTGGGRDTSRRFENGKVAGELCDFVIVTDEDPYDDDPMVIMQQVAKGVAASGKIDQQTYWVIPDRRVAIKQALQLAKPGDIVFLTCKGADQKICRAKGKKEPWDDRTVAREELGRICG